jgi:hypothetical protein
VASGPFCLGGGWNICTPLTLDGIDVTEMNHNGDEHEKETLYKAGTKPLLVRVVHFCRCI